MRSRRPIQVLAVATLLCTTARNVLAQTSDTPSGTRARSAGRLTVEEHPKVACVTESSVREAVGERLGYDPFEPAPGVAAADVRIVVSARGSRARAVLMVGAARRDLQADLARCTELRSSLALAVALLFESTPPSPQAAPAEPPPPPPREPPQTEARAPAAAPEPTKPAPTNKLQISVHATLSGHVGKLPAPFLGGMLGAGVGRAWWRVELEGNFDASLRTRVGTGSALRVGDVSASLYTAAVVPCAKVSVLVLCARASAGVLTGQLAGLSGFSFTQNDQSVFHLALGARAGVAIPLPIGVPLDALGLVDFDVPVVGRALDLGGSPLWKMPAVGLTGRLGLRLRL